MSALGSRYSSREMSYIWSDHFKYSTWRKIWTALAQAQKEVGIEIPDETIEKMIESVEDIDMDLV